MTDAEPLRRPVAPRPLPVSWSVRAGGLDAACVAPGPESHEPRNGEHVQRQ